MSVTAFCLLLSLGRRKDGLSCRMMFFRLLLEHLIDAALIEDCAYWRCRSMQKVW